MNGRARDRQWLAATACAMWKRAMPVDVVNTVVINRPVVDVSHYAADSDNAPRWYEAINLSNDDAFADFAERLIARFGGRVIERTVVGGPR